jgi:hypothetical protein
MADLYIRIRENNRQIVRGVSYDNTLGRFRAQVSEGETIKLTLDLTDWLNGATVTSSPIENNGVTCTKVEASGVFTLTASDVVGYGDSDLAIVASDGRTRVERFRFSEPGNQRQSDDYGVWP